MSMINLDGPPLPQSQVDKDDQPPGWWLNDNRLSVRTLAGITVYTLPRGARRIHLMWVGNGRAQLALGGFKSTTLTVTGPTREIERLREAIL